MSKELVILIDDNAEVYFIAETAEDALAQYEEYGHDTNFDELRFFKATEVGVKRKLEFI